MPFTNTDTKYTTDPISNYFDGVIGYQSPDAISQANSQMPNDGAWEQSPWGNTNQQPPAQNVGTMIQLPPAKAEPAKKTGGNDPFSGILDHVTDYAGITTPSSKAAVPPADDSQPPPSPTGTSATFDGPGDAPAKLPADDSQPAKPADTRDPFNAAKEYATHPGFEGVTAADVNAYRANPQGMDFATWYKKTGGIHSLGGPKPPGTEDPAIAAQWYATFPGFEGITADDVNEWRSNPQGQSILDWYMKKYNVGQVTPQIPHPPPTDPNQNPTQPWENSPWGNTNQTPQGGPQGAPPPPAPPTGGTTTTTSTSSSGGTSTTPPPAGAPGPNDDMLGSLRAAIKDHAARDMAERERALRSKMSLGGLQNTGAYDSTIAKAGIDGQVALTEGLSKLDYDAYNTEQDRTQKDRLAQLGSSDSHYNADTQLKIAKIQSDAQRYGAEKAAEASAAGASASAAASMGDQAARRYEADQRYKLGIAQLDVDREGNYLNFTTNQNKQIMDYINAIMGASPDAFLKDPFPTGNIITGKP